VVLVAAVIVEYLVQIMLLLELRILEAAVVVEAEVHQPHRLKQVPQVAPVLLFLDYIHKVNNE
jgi:hypothetical protein